MTRDQTGGKTREPKDTDHLLTLLTCLSRLSLLLPFTLRSPHVRRSEGSEEPRPRG